MEFYFLAPLRRFRRFLSFNSQRDGILPALLNQNGAPAIGFNSQRDGILHKRYRRKLPKTGGFNSQRDGILRMCMVLVRFATSAVSIPNGMEFYARFLKSCDRTTRFNSQRDGILHETDDINEVQAWCFNSQRDGILL